MHSFTVNIIKLLHIGFISFILTTPLSNSNYFLLLHSIIVPLLILHWTCNDNTCALTSIERYIRKEQSQSEYIEDFKARYLKTDCKEDNEIRVLIGPNYDYFSKNSQDRFFKEDFKNNYKKFTILTYGIALSLWGLTMCNLYNKYRKGLITDWRQLFII